MQAHIDIDGQDVLVLGDADLSTRSARRFFRTVLGAVQIDGGWRVARRSSRLQDLVVRIDEFLRSAGYAITRAEVAERSVELALERRRSIDRARRAADGWRDGQAVQTDAQISSVLNAMGWRPERTLRPHQMRNVSHALAAVNQANFSVPGAGKTATALATACVHLHAGIIDCVLVAGPLACFEPWESETRAALGSTLRTRRVRGTAAARRSVYQSATTNDVLLLSYATAAADRISIKAMCERLNVMLVVDESHRIKRFAGGVWAPALTEIAELARVRMILSGTPMPNSARDLYRQLNVLWPTGLLTGSRTDFAHRVDQGFQSVLADVRPFTIRTAKAELGLPPYSVQRHEIPMTGIQAEVYELVVHRLRDVVDDAATWGDKIEALRRARPIRLLQAAANPGLLNDPDDRFRLDSVERSNLTLMDRLARFDVLEEPCKSRAAVELMRPILENDNKVVCWSNFVRNLDSIRALIERDLEVKVFQVDGRVPVAIDDAAFAAPELEDDTRERRIEAFLDSPDPAVLVANPATCSESISLHRACRHAVYLDRTYDAALYLQSIDRVHRLGLPPGAEVTIHLLLATQDGHGSIDHLVDISLQNKQAAMEQLLNGAQILPLEQDESDAEGELADLDVLLRYLVGETDDED